MKYLFELSKEHKTLPKAEILACLYAENIGYNISESNEDVLVIETISKEDMLQRVASRLSLSREVPGKTATAPYLRTRWPRAPVRLARELRAFTCTAWRSILAMLATPATRNPIVAVSSRMTCRSSIPSSWTPTPW